MDSSKTFWEIVREALGYHSTSFADLPPILADRYHAAQSVMTEMFGDVEDFTALAPTVRPFIDAFWVAKDRTGEKAHNDEKYASQPESLTIGGYPVRWESLGGPTIYPLPSSTSARTAVVIAVPTEMDKDTGWPQMYPSTRGGTDGAQFYVLGVYGDIEEANAAIVRLGQAVRTLDAAARETARRADRFGTDAGEEGASF